MILSFNIQKQKIIVCSLRKLKKQLDVIKNEIYHVILFLKVSWRALLSVIRDFMNPSHRQKNPYKYIKTPHKTKVIMMSAVYFQGFGNYYVILNDKDLIWSL